MHKMVELVLFPSFECGLQRCGIGKCHFDGLGKFMVFFMLFPNVLVRNCVVSELVQDGEDLVMEGF
jgi:hypothetical protein